MRQRIDPPANPAKFGRGKPYDWQEFIDWQDPVLDYGLAEKPADEPPPDNEQLVPGGFVGHWRFLGCNATRQTVTLVGYDKDNGQPVGLDAGFLTAPPDRLRPNI